VLSVRSAAASPSISRCKSRGPVGGIGGCPDCPEERRHDPRPYDRHDASAVDGRFRSGRSRVRFCPVRCDAKCIRDSERGTAIAVRQRVVFPNTAATYDQPWSPLIRDSIAARWMRLMSVSARRIMSSGCVLASLMTTSACQIVHMSSSLKSMRLATVGWSGIAMSPVPTVVAPLAKRGTCQVDADHHATIIRRTLPGSQPLNPARQQRRGDSEVVGQRGQRRGDSEVPMTARS
jgi:hypothetical protein